MKAYTDIEQSKKLSEILPLESADMHYATWTILESEFIVSPNQGSTIKDLQEDYGNQIIPCWSLAALLQVIPKGNYKDFSLNYGGFQADKYIDEWFCSYQQTEPIMMLETHSDNPIDACVEMVVKLHEQELL